MNKKQIDRRTLLLGAATLTMGSFLCNSAKARDGAKLQSLTPGAARPATVDLVLTGADGQKMALSEKRGQAFFLHVWATWCAPCREELPRLDAFRAAHPDVPVIPVAASSGTPEKVAEFLKNAGLAHIGGLTVVKADAKGYKTLPEFGLPTTFLIDGQGHVRAMSNGGLDWSAPDAYAAAKGDLAAAG